MAAPKDHTGQRFGKLTAVEVHHSDDRHRYWTCRCDCGTEKSVRTDKLTRGMVKSCGCNQHPNRARPETWKIKNPTYRSWSMMIQRCTNPKMTKAYEYYQATGITVCDRWRDFNVFLNDMGERPPGTSIDRYPDPYGNYEPGNCRWATSIEQANNKRPWGTVAAKKFRKLDF